METQTEVMRRRVHRIGRGYRTPHRRPVGAGAVFPYPTTTAPAATAASATAVRPTPATPEVRYLTPVPPAILSVGVWLVTLAAGIMLGVGLAHHWG